MYRIGEVSSVNADKSIRVVYTDRDDTVTSDIQCVASVGELHVGDNVVCIYGEYEDEAICVGKLV